MSKSRFHGEIHFRRIVALTFIFISATHETHADELIIELRRTMPHQVFPSDQQDFRISATFADYLKVTTTSEKVAELISTGWDISVQAQPRSGGYPTFATISSELETLASTYPDYCHTYSIGNSVDGNSLIAMRITDNPLVHEPDEPRVKLVGGVHGNETSGSYMLLFLIRHILENRSTDPHISTLVSNLDLHILPIMNPDRWNSSRYNRNNIDLNRNFPSPFKSVVIQPETQAVMDWSINQQFLLSAGMHSGTVGVIYPWGNGENDFNNPSEEFPETALIRDLSLTYTANNPYMRQLNSGDWYRGTVNGTDSEPLNNEMADWSYRYTGCHETTIEISSLHTPSFSSLESYFISADRSRNNKDALLTYIAQALNCVRGRALDSETNAPIPAKVSIRQPTESDDYDAWMFLPPILPGWNPLGLARQPLNSAFNFGNGTTAWEFDSRRKTFRIAEQLQACKAYMVHSPSYMPPQLVAVAHDLPQWETSTNWQFSSLPNDGYLEANRGVTYSRPRTRLTRVNPEQLQPAGRACWVRAPATTTPAPTIHDWPRADNLPYPLLNAPATGQQINTTTDNQSVGWFHRLLGPHSTPLWIEAYQPSALTHAPPQSSADDAWSITTTLTPPLRPASVFIPDGEAFNQQSIPIPRTADIPLTPTPVTCRAVWQFSSEGNTWHAQEMPISDRTATAQLPAAPSGQQLRYYLELRGETSNILAREPSTLYHILATP